MDTGLVAANIGAAATLVLGIFGLSAPTKAAEFTSISPVGPNGTSEIRATYGGLFLAMGLLCLLLQSEMVFLTVAAAWIGAAAGRIWSVAIDRNVSAKNLGGVLFESVIGCLLTGSTW
jgi:Domain of unknown function (DUF4345)